MSESEYERLYQEFVRKGGGTYTFDGISQTPAEYYDITSLSELSAEERARLDAAQEQYNRQAALNAINDELLNGGFTNPLTNIVQSGRNSFNTMETDEGVLLLDALNSAINASLYRQDILDYFIASGIGLGFLSTSGLPSQAYPMYDQVQTHTDSQVSNLVQTIQDVNSLVSMSKQFGEQDNSCNQFNALMGLLSGSFDGIFSFLEGVTKPIMDFIRPFMGPISSIIGIIQGGAAGIINAISGVLSPIMSVFTSAMNSVSELVSKATGFISSITSQIASEVSGLLNMVSSLVQMAQALAIAAASFDVCQLAVLLRTGSPTLTSALQQYSTPLPSIPSAISTSIDPRANPLSVQNAVTAARQSTLTAPGVPQSPMIPSAMLYQPMSAYLTSPLSKLIAPISEAFSAIQTVTGQISMVKNALTNFQSFGSASGISTVDYVQPTSTVKMVKSKAFSTYSATYMNQILRRKTDLKTLRNEITQGISRNDVGYSTSVKGQAKSIIESLALAERSITTTMDGHTAVLVYSTPDGKRNEDIETFAKNEYDTVISPSVTGILTNTKRVYDTSLTWWNSVKIG
jgi:hypothetical protein